VCNRKKQNNIFFLVEKNKVIVYTKTLFFFITKKKMSLRTQKKSLSPIAIAAIVVVVIFFVVAVSVLLFITFRIDSRLSPSTTAVSFHIKKNANCRVRFADLPQGPLDGIWVGGGGFGKQIDALSKRPLQIGVTQSSGGVQPDTSSTATTAGAIFSVDPTGHAVVEVVVSSVIVGVDNAPYSSIASPFPTDDPRLVHNAFVLEDVSSGGGRGLSWGFYFSHGSIWAFSHSDAWKFGSSFASWMHGRRLGSYYPGTKVYLRLEYDRSKGSMEWYINGVFAVTIHKLGIPPTPRGGDVYAKDSSGLIEAADPTHFRIRFVGPDERAATWAGIVSVADIGLNPPPYQNHALAYPPTVDVQNFQHYGQAGFLTVFKADVYVCNNQETTNI